MPAWLKQDPAWVSEILHWQWVWFSARVSLTSAYLLGGLTKLLNFSAAIAEQERFGFRPGWLWAALTILIEIGGSVLILSGCAVWLGAGALGCLTAVAMQRRREWESNLHLPIMVLQSLGDQPSAKLR